MLRRMAVEPLCTTRGSKEDGDAQIDTHFQPSHIPVDDFNMDAKVAGVIQKVREQQHLLRENLEDFSKALEAGLAQQETLKKNLLKLGREMDATSSMRRRHIEELCKHWKVIAERRKSLESGHNIPGDLAMVAVYVEQAICAYVLPEVFSVNDVSANLYSLLKFLNGDNLFPLDPDECDCEGILSCAREKWETICKNFNFPDVSKTKAGGWTVYDSDVPGDIRAIEVLKMCGVCIDFPCPIRLKYAEEKVEAMKDKLPPWQFELIAEFIGSLRDKIIKTGLHHNYLHLD